MILRWSGGEEWSGYSIEQHSCSLLHCTWKKLNFGFSPQGKGKSFTPCMRCTKDTRSKVETFSHVANVVNNHSPSLPESWWWLKLDWDNHCREKSSWTKCFETKATDCKQKDLEKFCAEISKLTNFELNEGLYLKISRENCVNIWDSNATCTAWSSDHCIQSTGYVTLVNGSSLFG